LYTNRVAHQIDMTSVASGYVGDCDDPEAVGDDIYAGISRVGNLVLSYLPLRKCRAVYASLREFALRVPDVPECHGTRVGEMSPMHMVKVRTGVVDEERNVYLPKVDFLSMEVVERGIVSIQRLRSAPWTMVSTHGYREREEESTWDF
jgi:hypothetical protein